MFEKDENWEVLCMLVGTLEVGELMLEVVGMVGLEFEVEAVELAKIGAVIELVGLVLDVTGAVALRLEVEVVEVVLEKPKVVVVFEPEVVGLEFEVKVVEVVLK